MAESIHRSRKDPCTAGLQFNKPWLDQHRKYVVFVCIEAAEPKLVPKTGDQPYSETSPTVSVLLLRLLELVVAQEKIIAG